MTLIEALFPHALGWYIGAQAFAFAGSLIASSWLRPLADRGYAVGKALGLLFGAIIFWLSPTLGFAHNDRGAALVALAATWSLALALRRPFKIDWRWVVLVELIFAGAFFGWAAVRAYSPEVLPAGGEKFMELMMLNAILRSSHFPPNDAWLAGNSLSYYYLGYLLLALLVRLSAVPPAIAFNLGHALIFALTLVAAMGVGHALGATLWRTHTRAVATGLLAAAMVGLMGNLGALLGVLRCTNALPQTFWVWLDVREIATREYACRGVVPSAFYGWWWDWSRVIRDYAPDGTPQEVITETPIFSFVLGDNHPHVLSLPFALATLALGFAAMRTGIADPRRSWRGALHFGLTALTLGALAFLNTWDFPVYGAVFLAAVALGAWERGTLRAELVKAALVLAGGYLAYLPWHITLSSQVQGIGINLFNGTQLPQCFVMFAPLMVLWLGLVARTIAHEAQPAKIALKAALGGALLLVSAGAFALVLALVAPDMRALISEMLAFGESMGVTRAQVEQRLLARVLNPWTAIVLASGLVATVMLLLRVHALNLTTTLTTRFVLLLFSAGAALTLAVEFFFVRDLFGTRMNTVFKFYYQAWALWSVAGAVALLALLTGRGWERALGALAAVFIGAGLLWAPMAVLARSEFFTRTPTLDGAAYLQRSAPEDAAIIRWLNANLGGDPVILEASTLGAYRQEGRIAAFTGLPTVLGWGGHQHQWRGDAREAMRRHALVERAFATEDWTEAQAILEAFHVRYVILGEIERASFPAAGLAKFERACVAVFRAGASGVYDCASATR